MDISTTRRATSSHIQARKLDPSRIRISFGAATHILAIAGGATTNFLLPPVKFIILCHTLHSTECFTCVLFLSMEQGFL